MRGLGAGGPGKGGTPRFNIGGVEEPVLGASIRAAVDGAKGLGLEVVDAVLLHNSNRIAVRLVPCDVLARVATERDRGGAAFEVGMAQRLAGTGTPVALLEPRVAPGVHQQGDFNLTFWTYHHPLPPPEVEPDEYAEVLSRLHAGMRSVTDHPTPHFTDRVAEALRIAGDPDRSPELPEAGRRLLRATLERTVADIRRAGAPEQLLHGEPHPGNLLRTSEGLLFVDLETCCRGPLEFDVAHAPDAVGDRYPGLRQRVLRDCRVLMLAMVTSWRWDRTDQLPGGRALGIEGLQQLGSAPPRC